MNNNKPTAKTKDNRRYKYGGLSVGFTVVFLALIVALNLMFSAFSLSGDLTVDLTQEEFATIGNESVRLLTDLGDDLDVTIYFMSARDMFDNSANTVNGINMTALCRDLAEDYAGKFKGKIKVEYVELNSNPAFEQDYFEESGTPLSSTSVIIQGKYHFRILSMATFFTYGETNELTAFSGEYRMTNAIVRSCIPEKQVVAFTHGHGEKIYDGTISATSDAAALKAVFESAGFEVETVDLHTQEISDRTKMLITLAPTMDFDEAELDKINAFTKTKNAFIAFVDSSTPDLPNLQSFLNDYWGINYKAGYAVTDSDHSLKQNGDFITVKATEVSADLHNTSAAYQINKTIENFGKKVTVMPHSVELFVKPAGANVPYYTETVLTSYGSASSAKESADGKIEGTKGEIPTMLVSSKQSYGDNNVSEFAYVMLVGSTDFGKATTLAGETYGNKYILLAAARIFSSENYAADILAKEFVPTALTIETGTARTLTWLICTVIPGVILVLGVVMFFKRRHL